ncbi:MAG TPA: SIR2 family protein [Alphaproteobacteria bacterium]|nr:SIR2 family protein [Alphaproteobacteria bacterium]
MNTVLVLGAGATKACGGPLTNEILPHAFMLLPEYREQQINLGLTEKFLTDHFNVPLSSSPYNGADYPALPLVMSLIDIAIDRRHAFSAEWPVERLQELRQSLELLIFAVIDRALRGSGPNPQFELLSRVAQQGGPEPCVITLNYDIIADNALIEVGAAQLSNPVCFSDYGCDIMIPDADGDLDTRQRFGRLLKLHGSLNWHYCPNCHRLELGVSEDGSTIKVLDRFVTRARSRNRLLRDKYTSAAQCVACGARVRPVLISPSVQKDYRNPHIAQIWYQAEKTLQATDRVVFIGYSLPDDDVHVVYLLKRALERPGRSPVEIIVVDKSALPRDQNPVWLRYRSLFGNHIQWHQNGLQDWLDSNPPFLRSPWNADQAWAAAAAAR